MANLLPIKDKCVTDHNKCSKISQSTTRRLFLGFSNIYCELMNLKCLNFQCLFKKPYLYYYLNLMSYMFIEIYIYIRRISEFMWLRCESDHTFFSKKGGPLIIFHNS